MISIFGRDHQRRNSLVRRPIRKATRSDDVLVKFVGPSARSQSAKLTVKNVDREGKGNSPHHVRTGGLQRLVRDFVGEDLFVSLVEIDFGVVHGIDPSFATGPAAAGRRSRKYPTEIFLAVVMLVSILAAFDLLAA